jgi:hypothetical protein
MSIIQPKYIICKDLFLYIHDTNVINTLESKIASLFEYKKELYSTVNDIIESRSKLYHPSQPTILINYGLKVKLEKKYKSVNKLIENVNSKIVINKLRLKLKIKRMNLQDKTLKLDFKELDTDVDYDEESNLESDINVIKAFYNDEFKIIFEKINSN